MGRGNKVGLDYFELDCHMDEKIELVEAEYGLKGFAIIVKLYQSIYSGLGYYCEWTPDISLLWAARLSGSHGGVIGKVGSASYEGSLSGFPKNLINDVVAASIRRGIFSEELFQKYHILTSSGIQKRYLNATSKREKVELKKEYLLISIPKNRHNVVINSISGVRNAISGAGNAQRNKEESRVYNLSVRARKIEDFILAYPKKCNRHLTEIAYADLIMEDVETEENLVACARNYAEACRIEKTPERYIKNAENFLKDFVFAKYLPGKYKKPERKAANRFNDFEQREYNCQNLEKMLLGGGG